MVKNIEARLAKLEDEVNSDNERPSVHLITSIPFQAYGKTFNSTDELLTYEDEIYGPQKKPTVFLHISKKRDVFTKPHTP